MPGGNRRTLALVLMKSLREAKSRLAGVMSPAQRRRLSSLMLRQVLRAVERAGVQGRVLISSDRSLGRIAASHGFRLLLENGGGGFSRALEFALAKGVAEGYEDLLILPGDLPLLGSSQLAGALALRRSLGLPLLSPSLRFDGTNLMLVGQEELPPLHYERDSFLGHVREFCAQGRGCCVLYDIRLALDIDEAEDLRLARALFPRSAFSLLLEREGLA